MAPSTVKSPFLVELSTKRTLFSGCPADAKSAAKHQMVDLNARPLSELMRVVIAAGAGAGRSSEKQ
jgi:hypothetical protein